MVPGTSDRVVYEESLHQRCAVVRAVRVDRVHDISFAHDDERLAERMRGEEDAFRDLREGKSLSQIWPG